MVLLVWPLLVFVYYKQKDTLKFWLWFFVFFGSAASVLGAAEFVYIALLQHAVVLPIFWLSAKFTAWCIKRYVSPKKNKPILWTTCLRCLVRYSPHPS